MSSKFLTLPYELRIMVLSNLDPLTIFHCSMTCKSIYDTLKNSTLYEYAIQLHLDGLQDAGTCASYRDLIEELLRQRRAWFSTERASRHLFNIYADSWEIAGSLIVCRTWGLQDLSHLEFIWLPTAKDGQERRINVPLIGPKVWDFKIESTQDLLILAYMDGTIHIRNISNTAPHPLARRDSLDVKAVFTKYRFFEHMQVQISGNVFALIFCHPRREVRFVQIWDWMSSELLMDSTTLLDPDSESTTGAFCFLDSTSFIMGSTLMSGSLNLYKLAQDYDSVVRTIHCATLRLPTLVRGARISSFMCWKGPNEAYSLPLISFTVNQRDLLLVFQPVYICAEDLVQPEICIHQSVFMRYLSQDMAGSEVPLDVQWDDWGPLNTAMFNHRDRRTATGCSVYGQRLVRKLDNKHIYEVFDFSRAATMSAKGKLPLSLNPGRDDSAGTVDTTLQSSHKILAAESSIFQKDIETHLPFVSTKYKLKKPKQDHRDVAATASGLVIIRRNRQLRCYEADVYYT